MRQATEFTAECVDCSSRETRVPKLASLPPTTEAFAENVRRAHLQSFL